MRAESLKRDSLWLMGGQMASSMLQAIYFVLIGRSLGSQQYGAFIGVVALVSVASQFSGLGMEMLLLRDVSRDRHSFAMSWGRALQVTGIGAVLLVLGVETVGHWIFARGLWPLLPYVAIADGFFGRILQVASRAFQATRQMRWAAVLPVLMSALRAAVAGIFWEAIRAGYVDPSAQAWVTLYWVASAAAAMLAIVLLSILLGGPHFMRLRWRDMTEGLSFAFSSSSISVYNDIDKTLLLSAGQLEAAGIYGAAYRVVDAATTPVYSLFAAASPRYFRAGAQGADETRQLMKRLVTQALPYTTVISMALFSFAGWLPVVLGKSFAGSVEALRWLCLLPMLRLLHYTWGTAITASTSQWRRTATQAGAAGLNLALCLWMIPRWSWRGAAIASLVTDGALVVLSVAVWWHWSKRRMAAGEPAFVKA